MTEDTAANTTSQAAKDDLAEKSLEDLQQEIRDLREKVSDLEQQVKVLEHLVRTSV